MYRKESGIFPLSVFILKKHISDILQRSPLSGKSLFSKRKTNIYLALNKYLRDYAEKFSGSVYLIEINFSKRLPLSEIKASLDPLQESFPILYWLIKVNTYQWKVLIYPPSSPFRHEHLSIAHLVTYFKEISTSVRISEKDDFKEALLDIFKTKPILLHLTNDEFFQDRFILLLDKLPSKMFDFEDEVITQKWLGRMQEFLSSASASHHDFEKNYGKEELCENVLPFVFSEKIVQISSKLSYPIPVPLGYSGSYALQPRSWIILTNIPRIQDFFYRFNYIWNQNLLQNNKNLYIFGTEQSSTMFNILKRFFKCCDPELTIDASYELFLVDHFNGELFGRTEKAMVEVLNLLTESFFWAPIIIASHKSPQSLIKPFCQTADEWNAFTNSFLIVDLTNQFLHFEIQFSQNIFIKSSYKTSEVVFHLNNQHLTAQQLPEVVLTNNAIIGENPHFIDFVKELKGRFPFPFSRNFNSKKRVIHPFKFVSHK